MKFIKPKTIKENVETKSSMENAGTVANNTGCTSIPYANAVEVSAKKAKEINKEMKPKQKEVDEIVKENEREAHKKLPKSQGLKKLKLSEATAVADVDTDVDFSDEREDPYETFEDYDMFVFITNLFTRDLKDHQRPLKPLGRTHKHFEYSSKDEVPGSSSQVGTTREGDIILKSDNVKDFDDVVAICDKYKFEYKGPTESKGSRDYAYSITIVVPKTKGGYPLNVEDYFESINIDPKTVLPKWYFNIKKKYNKRYGIEEDYIYNENETLAEQAEAIADYLSEFLNTAANTEDINEYLNEDELKEVGDMMDNFYWLAKHYGKIDESAPDKDGRGFEKITEDGDEDEEEPESLNVIGNLKSYKPWEGAVNVLNNIKEANKVDRLDSMLKEMYPKGITAEKLNDLLWFESDWVYEMLDMTDYLDDADEE